MGLFSGTRRLPAEKPSGCWVCTGGGKSGGMCSAHQRQVKAAALRESRPGYRARLGDRRG